MHISTTDLEITLHCSVPVNVVEAGSALIPAKLFGEAVKSLPDRELSLTYNQDEGEASLTCGTTTYTIKGLPIEDYPQLPEMASDDTLSLPGEAVTEAIRQVIRAVGRDEARPALTGVLFLISDKIMKIVATDSYRLAVKEMPLAESSDETSVIVPARAVEEMSKLAGSEEILIAIGENQIFFRAGEITLISRLIEGQYPKYQQLIPAAAETTVRFNKEILIDAIKRVSIISPNAVIRMVFGDGLVKLGAYASDVGSASDEVECVIKGEGVEIAFNAQYILDGLMALKDKEAVLEMTGSLKAAILKNEGRDDYLYLIMPIRLS